ncbi:hypothetical protein H072_6512 [Dactylellina haptotyla CBS 200.50]|uniref:Uncharacterized protein n=1 Tax=Dactylellina haptotyla (strain CBS 200.50) TaxID=1284197 RepID=S8BK35_DACHA|nr:hypothetical protein H072_6512 [Dactylellina haptotyla CBS 200.50]
MPPNDISLYNLDLTNNPILDEMLLYYGTHGPGPLQRFGPDEAVTFRFRFDFRNAIPLPLDAAVEFDSRVYEGLTNVSLKELCMLAARCIAAQKREINMYKGHEWVNVEIASRQNAFEYCTGWMVRVTDGDGRRIR